MKPHNISPALLDWQSLIESAQRFAQDSLHLRVTQVVQPEQLREELAQSIRFDQGYEPQEVVSRVESLLQRFNTHVTHPRYFGLFNPSVRPISVVADTMAALYNPQLATWSHAPAACELERLVLFALADRIGLSTASLVCNFTSGGAEANLSAVLVALARFFPESLDRGIGNQRPTIYLTSESHHSFAKIAKMTGLGRRALREVPVTATLQMDVDALREMIEHDRREGAHPMMVVGTAGTTAAGIIDPLQPLAELCAQEQIWFHVDAAWGGSAGLTPRLKHLLRGIECADSVTWDAHKWLFVPMAAGMFFCRHRSSVAAAFSTETTYMPSAVSSDVDDPYQMTTQWSRRMIGLKVLMAIAELGWTKLAQYIEHQTDMGNQLRGALLNAGWCVVNSTELPVVCFTHPRIQRGEITTSQILQTIYARGLVWISDVTLANRDRVLRACITSYSTSSADVACLVSELEASIAVG